MLLLRGCTLFQLEDHHGTVLADQREIAERSPELLSIVSEAPLTIYTTLGTLTLAYRALELALDTGQPLATASLDQASSSYWQAWSERHGGSA